MTGCSRMTSHSSPASGPGLCRTWSGIADLADVVQQRGVADALDLDVVEAEGGRDGLAISTTNSECSPV